MVLFPIGYVRPIGVDRSRAGFLFEAFDLVKEICQACDCSATIRPWDLG